MILIFGFVQGFLPIILPQLQWWLWLITSCYPQNERLLSLSALGKTSRKFYEEFFCFWFFFRKMMSLFNFSCFSCSGFSRFLLVFEKSGFVRFYVRYREMHVCSCSNLEFPKWSIKSVNQVICQIASVILKAIRIEIKVY